MALTTRISAPVQSEINGKWCSAFENWRTFLDPSEDYMASSVVSAAVWPTEEAAEEASIRALQTLETTGKYPNMCEPW